MEVAAWLTALLAAVLLLARLGARLGRSTALLLVVAGFALSFVPFVPAVEISPELVLLGFLPPLLFAGASRMSLTDFRAELRPILLLSVGLVVLTAFAIAGALVLLLPIPFPIALALGAVVAPPDAVAAVAIGRRIGLPRRVVTVLEGESLVNDASALVLLRLALVAISTQFGAWEIVANLALAVGGGVAVGVVVALGVARLQARLSHTATLTALSLLTPWLAYLPAEAMHASGILAVVTAGLWLAHGPNDRLDPVARINRRTNWSTVTHLLESTVFLLVGMQLRRVLERAVAVPDRLGVLALICGVTLLTLLLVRPIWLLVTAPLLDKAREQWTLAEQGLIAWAGMRGVVTLAAALLLPADLPYREEIVIAAMVVVLVTLLGQGFTLPWLARRLRVKGPDPRLDALQEAEALRLANRAGLDVLAALRADPGEAIPDQLAQQLRARTRMASEHAWETVEHEPDRAAESTTQAYRRVRLAMIRAERSELQHLRDSHRADHEVIARILEDLDVEELLLSRAEERLALVGDAFPLSAVQGHGKGCEHLAAVAARSEPLRRSDRCEDCEREGTRAERLRMCLICGNVGCCDSSPGRHARRHYELTGHTVMRSIQPGEVWRWCYVDETSG